MKRINGKYLWQKRFLFIIVDKFVFQMERKILLSYFRIMMEKYPLLNPFISSLLVIFFNKQCKS
jgi:hypothetical protein